MDIIPKTILDSGDLEMDLFVIDLTRSMIIIKTITVHFLTVNMLMPKPTKIYFQHLNQLQQFQICLEQNLFNAVVIMSKTLIWLV